MTNKEKKLKAIIDLLVVNGRIDEVKRSKTNTISITCYRNRLRILEEKREKLERLLNDEEEVETIKVTVSGDLSDILGKKFFSDKEDKEDVIQYLKRTIFVKE